MEKPVAKRKLKKSYYEKPQYNVKEFIEADSNVNGIYIKNTDKANYISNIKEKMKKYLTEFSSKLKITNCKKNGNEYITRRHSLGKENWVERFKNKTKVKLAYQSITAILLSLFILAVNIFNISTVKQLEITKQIVREFKTHHEIYKITNRAKGIYDNFVALISPIIPDDISNKTIEVFNSLKNKSDGDEVKIYEETNEQVENKIDNSGQGYGVVVVNAANILEAVGENESSTSVEKIIKEKILISGVTFVAPTYGYITSNFGAREEIFQGVDPYHYGVDIANSLNTPIYSSIAGKVIKAEFNSEAGNYIEVENGSIITRYCHLNKFDVVVGQEVKAGQQIAKMGTTGLSTGPHLHFEIMYNKVRIDPLEIVSIKRTK